MASQTYQAFQTRKSTYVSYNPVFKRQNSAFGSARAISASDSAITAITAASANTAKQVSEEGVMPMYSISVLCVLKDLRFTLASNDAKREKRLKRYSICCKLEGIETDIPEATDNSRNLKEGTKQWYKNTMNSKLTELSWENVDMYNMTLQVLLRIRTALYRDMKLRPLIDSRQIILTLKGGRAHKYALKQKYPDDVSEIDESFGSDGDNDVSILIDPSLANFESIHMDVRELTYRSLKRIRDEMIRDTKSDLYRVNSEINELFKQGEISSFIRPNTAFDQWNGEKHSTFGREMYVTFTMVKFPENKNIDFALIRLMKSYELEPNGIITGLDIPQLPVSSEILDVGIPCKNDHNLWHFEKYHSGSDGYLIEL